MKHLALFLFFTISVLLANAQDSPEIHYKWGENAQIATSARIEYPGRLLVKCEYYRVIDEFLYVTEKQYDEGGTLVYTGMIAFYRSNGKKIGRIDKESVGTQLYDWDYNWRVYQPENHKLNKALRIGAAVLGGALIINDIKNGHSHKAPKRRGHRPRRR